MATKPDLIVRALLDRYGRRYAEEAGIRLADRPGPLYQLLVLATLLSARISADIAVAAARELFAAGYRSPEAMRDASWQDRVDALGRGRYRRYDESTATRLGDGAALLCAKWRGDLRRLRDKADGDRRRISSLLIEFPGIGPTGASIFLREVQHVWPSVVPYVDSKMISGARLVGLPGRPEELAELLSASREPARAPGEVTAAVLSRCCPQMPDARFQLIWSTACRWWLRRRSISPTPTGCGRLCSKPLPTGSGRWWSTWMAGLPGRLVSAAARRARPWPAARSPVGTGPTSATRRGGASANGTARSLGW